MFGSDHYRIVIAFALSISLSCALLILQYWICGIVEYLISHLDLINNHFLNFVR